MDHHTLETYQSFSVQRGRSSHISSNARRSTGPCLLSLANAGVDPIPTPITNPRSPGSSSFTPKTVQASSGRRNAPQMQSCTRCIIYFSVNKIDNHISLFLPHSVGLPCIVGPDEGVHSKIGVICIGVVRNSLWPRLAGHQLPIPLTGCGWSCARPR